MRETNAALPDWPRVHGAPIVTAELRSAPEDFRVVEELGFTASGDGEHDLLGIEKTGANTDWVARALARHAGVRAVDVGYSGLKDRDAVTTQSFTVRRPGREGTDWSSFAVAGVRILSVARHHRKLRRGSHAANRFRIVARCADSARHAEALAARWDAVTAAGVPNYFGPQRFGRDGGNLVRARAMFAGARLSRDQKSLALSAVRAWLFNRILAARVRDASWDRLLPGDLVNLDGSNSVFHADAPDSELAARCARFDLHPAGSLWGKGAPVGRSVAAERETDAVAPDAELVAGIEAAGVAAGHRPLRVRPAHAGLHVEDGGGIVFEFALPPGAFATSVLLEIIAAA